MRFQVNTVSQVIDNLDNLFPHTTIENLHDSHGNELPIRGVFYDKKSFNGSPENRLVVLHSKGEDYYFQSREDAIDQAITAWKAIRNMGGDDITMQATFNKGYFVSFEQKVEYSKRKFIFENDILLPSYNFNFSYDSTSSGDGGSKRIICKNLITTRKIAGFHFSVRHTKNMGQRMIDIEKGIAKITESYPQFVAYCEKMALQSVKLDDAYAAIYGEKPDTKRGFTVWSDRKEDIRLRLNREANILGISQDNGWLIFNAFQGYLSHDTTRKDSHPIIRAESANNSKELMKLESLILGA